MYHQQSFDETSEAKETLRKAINGEKKSIGDGSLTILINGVISQMMKQRKNH